MLGSASADCELGEIDRADRALAEARAAMQGVFPPGSPPALTAAGLEGRVALALGQLDDAKRVFTSTINVHEAQGQPGGGVVCSTFTALMWRYGSNSRRRLYRMQNGHPTWPAACRAALPTRAEPA